MNQFAIKGYSKPYMFDGSRNGGGVFICVPEDILSKKLKNHNSPGVYSKWFYRN